MRSGLGPVRAPGSGAAAVPASAGTTALSASRCNRTTRTTATEAQMFASQTCKKLQIYHEFYSVQALF